MLSRLTRLWHELRQRRVVQTTIAYVIGAWIVIEVTSVIFPIILLPDWAVRIVTVLAIVGLPMVIALSWIFDIERKSESGYEDGLPASAPLIGSSGPAASTLPPTPMSAVASVAVLRFKNLTPSDENPYIADGIAMELHSTLAKLYRLRVASLRSSFALSEDGRDVRAIGKELRVSFIISGSVQHAGDRLHVIVELDNADEGVQIWSESFDRGVEDLISIQQEIAEAVTSAFGGARLREEISTARMLPTESLDAWNLVQRARAYVLGFTPQSLADAAPLLRRAIGIDQNYAAAHAALASVLAEQILNGLNQDKERDRESALESAHRSFNLSPFDPFVLKMCGMVWAYLGKPEESKLALRRAVGIAQFDFGAWGYMGWPLAATGSVDDLAESHEIMERLLATASQHPGVPYWLYHRSVAYSCQSKTVLALDFARKSVELNPTYPWGWMNLAHALGAAGNAAESESALARGRQISPGLTPEHYAFMIREMSSDETIIAARLAGITNQGANIEGP